MDLTNLIWSLFSENGTAADAFYRSTNRQTCIITGIEFILMCRRECFHNWIKEDSNLDLTCVQTQTVAFSTLHILLLFKASLGQHSLPSYYRPTYKERSAELLTVVISLCFVLRSEPTIFKPQQMQLQQTDMHKVCCAAEITDTTSMISKWLNKAGTKQDRKSTLLM